MKVISVRRDRTRKNGVVLTVTGVDETHTVELHLTPNAVYRIARLARSRHGYTLFAPVNGLFGRN